MSGIATDSLALSGVEIRFLFTAHLGEFPNIGGPSRIPRDWVVGLEEVEARIFHSRYREIVSPLTRIVCQDHGIECLDMGSFESIPWPKGTVSYSTFKLFLEEKGDVLNGKTFRPVIFLYPEGVTLFEILLKLDGDFSVDHLVALVNGLIDFDAKLRMLNGERVTLQETVARIAERLVQKQVNQDRFFERFSVISATAFTPNLETGDDYFSTPYFKELAGVAIRRALQYQDIRPKLLKPVENLALYRSDVVTLTYHNMLCVLHGQLGLEFYLCIVRALKAMTTLLQHYDIEAYRLIREIKRMPRWMRLVRKRIRELEQLRLGITRSLDAYRMLTAVSATRARMILQKALEIFSIKDLVADLKDSMVEIDELLSGDYRVRLQRTLQWFAITIAVFTLIVTLVEVVGTATLRSIMTSIFDKIRAMFAP